MKKLIKNSFTIVSCLFFISYFSLPVFAGNTQDTSWNWHMPGYSLERYTPIREKTDTSSAYFKAETVRVYGGVVKAKTVYDDGSNPRFQEVRTIDHPMEVCLASYAYEGHGPGTRIKIRGDRIGQYEMWLSGVWSPDSVGCPFD